MKKRILSITMASFMSISLIAVCVCSIIFSNKKIEENPSQTTTAFEISLKEKPIIIEEKPTEEETETSTEEETTTIEETTSEKTTIYIEETPIEEIIIYEEETTISIPEEEIEIEIEETETIPEEEEEYYEEISYLSDYEYDLFVRLVSAEGGWCGDYYCAWLIASTVANHADYYGISIEAAITYPGHFSAYSSGLVWSQGSSLNSACYAAVDAVLSGDRNYDVFYFGDGDIHASYAGYLIAGPIGADGMYFRAR